MPEKLTTHDKALAVNLDPTRYGSFAEIGAGQEVVRWFFRVGAAAGTIAKTVSAYDKEISDAMYGVASRYVSRGRLQAMLDYEYQQLVDELDDNRGEQTKFFTFADTVAAQNYRGNADCHGWMGVRFQTDPRSDPSEVVLHARMLDRDALTQSEALGILGVNLVYGAAALSSHPETLLASLLDSLGTHRIEIDAVRFSGSAFRDVDHRVMSLRLVEFGLSQAAMFSASGEVVIPSETLYKKSVVLQRGRFRPPTRVHADIQNRATEKLRTESGVDDANLLSVLEISCAQLQETQGSGLIDFLDQVEALNAEHHVVLISDFPEHYLVAEYLSRYAARTIVLPVSAAEFAEVMTEEHHSNLSGGILEASSRLFRLNVQIFLYPGIDPETGRRIELDSLQLSPEIKPLVEFLVSRGFVSSLEGLSDDELRVRSDDVFNWIQNGESDWENKVSPEVAAVIKSRRLFGFSG